MEVTLVKGTLINLPIKVGTYFLFGVEEVEAIRHIAEYIANATGN